MGYSPTDRGEAGQTSIEWVAVGAVVVAIVLAVVSVAPGLADTVGDGVRSVVCRATSTACDGGDGSTDGTSDGAGDTAEQAAARSRLADVADEVEGLGEGADDLVQAAQDAIDAGDLETAEALTQRLELIARLTADPERGDLVTQLLTADDAAFEALIADGTIYLDDGTLNTAYFQIEPQPGGGVVVMDYFIDSGFSGPLAGDDRGHEDPFGGSLDMEDSRIMIVMDLETGRGQIIQSESCLAFGGPCNEPRPITFDGSAIVNDSQNDITGEGINLDIANQFWISEDGDGIRIDYDALNSITPTGSIDGGITVLVAPDGSTIGLDEDDRENYPSIGTYYYPPGQPTQVIEEREQEGVICGAIVIINNLC